MTVSLRLESDVDSLDLSSIENTGYGVQALSGVTGMGLPPVDVQWVEGAGDGATYRGQRVLAREMDLPIYVLGRDRTDLKSYLSRLARILNGPARLVFSEGRDDEWSTIVARTGGGDWAYGIDTRGMRDAQTVLTLRAGDPYFTSMRTQVATIRDSAAAGLLTGSLSAMHLSSSQSLGTITLTNEGDADAYPVWTIVGPGRNFQAISEDGESLVWNGTLNLGDTLTIDTKLGTVIDQTGANRYSSLAPMPRMWPIPPGITKATATMTNTTPGVSSITCTWRARRWVNV